MNLITNSIYEGHIQPNTLILDDCFNVLHLIPDNSQDLILVDLPFGTTQCDWDLVLPMMDHYYWNGKVWSNSDRLEKYLDNGLESRNYSRRGLWYHYNRILKPNGVILAYAQTPFDKVLGASNLEMLKYEWIWEKTSATGHLNAKKMPMKAHENVLVFYKSPPTYNPQKTKGHVRKVSKAEHKENCTESNVYNKGQQLTTYDSTERYPRSVLKFPSDKQKNKLDGTLYDTQKPYALNEYFIRTYTNPGDSVFTNVAGSGSEILPCVKLGRTFIGIEKDRKPFDIMVKRFNKELI